MTQLAWSAISDFILAAETVFLAGLLLLIVAAVQLMLFVIAVFASDRYSLVSADGAPELLYHLILIVGTASLYFAGRKFDAAAA